MGTPFAATGGHGNAVYVGHAGATSSDDSEGPSPELVSRPHTFPWRLSAVAEAITQVSATNLHRWKLNRYR
jgi:hypothetical protein